MVGTIILGATFKASMSSHKADFARLYPHRVITRRYLQILLSRQRHGSSTEITSSTLPVLQHSDLLQQGSSLFSLYPQSGYIKLLTIPKRNHKSPTKHLQD